MDDRVDTDYAIHAACREGRLSQVESLLSVPRPPLSTSFLTSKANKRLSSKRDQDDRLPIHWATSYNHIEIVELLASKSDFDPDVKDGSGWTPLMMASSLKEGDALVDLLIRKDADVNAKNDLGQTALHFCASKSNLSIARSLIAAKATCRVKDRRGQLPLHRAAAVGCVPIARLFIDNNSPLNASDDAGQTALHHAIAEGHGDLALMLLKAGAESDKVDGEGQLAINTAPDAKVRSFILQSAEKEGIEVTTSVS